MNKKRLLQQYQFILDKYKYSDEKYTNTYEDENDLYTFLNEYDNMNVYSLYPEMIIFKLGENKKVSFGESDIKKFKYKINKMKNIYIKIKNKFEEFEGNDKKNIHEYTKLKKKYENKLISKYMHYQIIDYLREKLDNPKITNAWLKCYEIIYKFKLINGNKCKSFHICELPGAFILAIQYYCAQNNIELDWIGQSLNPYNEQNIKLMKGKYLSDKYRLARNNKDRYDWGIKGTGDITDINNIKYYHKKYRGTRDLVTSDCGQDSSNNFYNQEIKLNKVMWGQFVCAVGLLKKGGNYFAKIFTVQSTKMIEYIYLCTTMFENVYIVKPMKTRMISGERYLVCENFLDNDTDKYLEKMYSYMENFDRNNLLDLKIIKDDFIDELDMCNVLMGKRRLININKMIYLINNINYYTQHSKIKKHIDKMVTYYVKYFCEYYDIGV